MPNKKSNNNKNKSYDEIFNLSEKIGILLKNINNSNEESTIITCKNKIIELIKRENRSLKFLKSNISVRSLNRLEKDLGCYLDEINNLESETNGSKNDELDRLILEAHQLYKQIEAQYISIKFDKLNQRLDDKMEETENATSSIMFNVISIFLGISITSAMITGIEYIESEFIIFYFLSCAWIALTILTISAIYFKRIDCKTIIITVIYGIFTIIWIIVGLIVI